MSLEEGVIKFNCQWEKTAPFSDSDGILNELIRFRQFLFDKKLIGCYPNGIGYGNISMRKKEKSFYISGSGSGGVEVLGMVAIFTYGFQAAEDNFAGKKCVLHTLSDYDTLLKQAVASDYINDSQLASLNDWRSNPSTWKQ